MEIKKAFTLSEVLITLGIIGVVAALTIPVIISKIDERETIVHWKKMYSVLSQAYIKAINEDHPPCPRVISEKCSFDLSTSQAFNSDFLIAFAKNLNAKILCANRVLVDDSSIIQCDSTNGVYNYFHPLKSLAGGDVAAYGFKEMVMQLPTGEHVMFGGAGNGEIISVSLNGYGDGKNQLGKEIFVMKAFEKSLKPMGADGTFDKNRNGDVCKCGKEYGVTSATYIEYQELPSGTCCSAYYLTK